MGLQMYKEDELKDSLVVDSEGYICGYVSGFMVESNNIRIKLYAYEKNNIETPNEEELQQRLLESVPQKGFYKKSSVDSLYDSIRNSLSISKNDHLSLEHLIKYANTKNLKIPMKTEETQTRVDNGIIDWDCIDKIAFSQLGKCLLLNEPIEAKKRSVAMSDEVGFKSTKELKGKMVIDSEGKIVGSAFNFLIGSPPGLSIRLEQINKMEKYETEDLKSSLIPSRFKNEKELLAEVKKDLKLNSLNSYDSRAIAIWAKRNNVEIQNKADLQKMVVSEVTYDWDKIRKIGDVVILKESLKLPDDENNKMPVTA